MNWVQTFSLLALIVLVVITLVRLPSAITRPSSRLAWLATLSGVAAFTMVGVIVPIETLDGWLGGTNLVNLLQNLFATTAFWFLMQAARTVDGSPFNRSLVWELPAMLAAFTLPFFLIPDRGPTSAEFIKVHAAQPSLWAYASIYMGCVIFIMLRLMVGIRGRHARQYVLIRIGATGIVIGSALEILYLTLRVTDFQPRWLVDLVDAGFVLPFYGGVIVAAVGLAAFAFVTHTRSSVLIALRVLLMRANTGRGLTRDVLAEADDDPYDTYRLAVRLTDIANSEPLNWRERMILGAATRMLDRQMSGPAVVRMTAGPQQVKP